MKVVFRIHKDINTENSSYLLSVISLFNFAKICKQRRTVTTYDNFLLPRPGSQPTVILTSLEILYLGTNFGFYEIIKQLFFNSRWILKGLTWNTNLSLNRQSMCMSMITFAIAVFDTLLYIHMSILTHADFVMCFVGT